jgi:Arc/MetJ-type ribon-helix-helix transcriptional regulator
MENRTTIELDSKMQEIVDLATQAGLGNDAGEIVRLALEDWWGNRLIENAGPDEVRRILEEAAADTRPGLSSDVVFAELRAELQREPKRADAA